MLVPSYRGWGVVICDQFFPKVACFSFFIYFFGEGRGQLVMLESSNF